MRYDTFCVCCASERAESATNIFLSFFGADGLILQKQGALGDDDGGGRRRARGEMRRTPPPASDTAQPTLAVSGRVLSGEHPPSTAHLTHTPSLQVSLNFSTPFCRIANKLPSFLKWGETHWGAFLNPIQKTVLGIYIKCVCTCLEINVERVRPQC